MKMTKVNTVNGYDFYVGIDENNKPVYNIIPKDNPKCTAGYYDREYIANIKHQDSCLFTIKPHWY